MRALAITCALLGACGDRQYTVVLVAEAREVVDGGSIWELFLLRGECNDSLANGSDPEPSAVVAELEWTRGEPGPEVGELDPGSYAFYARVRDDDCAVRWGACRVAQIKEDGEGRIELGLRAIDGPPCIDDNACNGAEVCDRETGCTRSAPIECDDGVGCTIDRCADPAGECVFAPDHSLCPGDQLCGSNGCAPGDACGDDNDCDDDDFCNGEERCQGDVCLPAETLPCAGEFACTVPACDPIEDECVDADRDNFPCFEDCDDTDENMNPDDGCT